MCVANDGTLREGAHQEDNSLPIQQELLCVLINLLEDPEALRAGWALLKESTMLRAVVCSFA